MLKYKEETPQNVSVEVNKVNKNILLQKTEQTAEVLVMDNKDTSKQSWAKMMDNDSDNLKDITNATNPWTTPSTSKTNTEHTSTESDILHNKREETQIGLEGLLKECFFDNIDNMISTSTNEEIKNVHEPNLYSDYEHEDMQTDAVLHKTQAESKEVAINEENKEMVAEPSDSLKDTKEKNTYNKNVETPTIASTCPDKEMATMDSSLDTNGTKVEMIDTTENDIVTRNADVRGSCKMVAQCNEDLRDKLNTLSFTNNIAARSNEHIESHTLETAIKITQPGDTEWLHSEGFTPVINKKLAASKKNKKTEESRLQEAESRPSPYKKEKDGIPSHH
ncbi:16260_t:CDS:2 [Gigaspora margarita]|uniref:16260_t:CDS:1 n=1 Tax=Gigaspora margarita TaxID=4874 RepID=A0ABN7UYY7_GIGMA|nr:16260_t:CDS:2 [Gigaspora margarita]